MDDAEDPLGKISRQLSELAATSSPSLPLGLDPDSVHSPIDSSGRGWTQFSGFGTQASGTSAPFGNLYSWNPMEHQDFEAPLLPRGQIGDGPSILSQPPPQRQAIPVSYRGHQEFCNTTPYDIGAGGGPGSNFQASGDLGGCFADRPQGMMRMSGGHHVPRLLTTNNAFDPSYAGMHMGQMPRVFEGPIVSRPSEESLGLPRAQSPSYHGLSPTMDHHPQSFFPMDGGDDMSRHILPRPPSHDQGQPPSPLSCTPVFDPRTPPPTVPLQKQILPESPPAESLSPLEGKTPEVLDLLQTTSNIKLDLGTSIAGQQYCEVDTAQTTSEEEQNMYTNALSQWYKERYSSETPAKTKDLPTDSLHQESKDTETAKVSQVSESLKPSYSDIAKTPKSSSGHQQAPAKPDSPGFDSGIRFHGKKPPPKKDIKPMRPHVKRTSSGSKFFPRISLGGDSDTKVSPNSKYGLDSFDDLTNAGSHSSSSESLIYANRSRRGSGSSVGSGNNNVDDITLATQAGQSSSDVSIQKNNLISEEPTNPAKPSEKKSSHCPSKSRDSVFFDPRRIFQSKNTNKSHTPVAQSASNVAKTKSNSGSVGSSSAAEDLVQEDLTVLNNGKPTHSSSSKLSNSGQHDYINNDLRDASKLTNQTAAENGQQVGGHQGTRKEPAAPRSASGSSRKSTGRANNGVYRRDRRKSPEASREEQKDNVQNHPQRFAFIPDNFDMEKLEEWFVLAWEKAKMFGHVAFNTIFNLCIQLLGLILYLAVGGVHLSLLLVRKCWFLVRVHLLGGWLGGSGSSGWPSRSHPWQRVGLEENINLPPTGEDAMKRLLSCKGKDPYSILGLRADSSDEDIKKYYRKQAVLVHPDKNQEPGAEEAFKILGHAFEMIGDPSKRKQYDSHTQEASEAEQRREFAEMLSKLQTKIQEAANIMRCDNCGGRHRRVPVDRPFYSARFCQRCNIHHSAKEGDVWAESKMLGFYWHYYALMEGHVYDITEWMRCHKEYFKHMKANAHAVLYRIATDGNKRNRHHHSNEGNLEDIINQLFSRTTGAASGSGEGSRASWNPNGSTPGGVGQSSAQGTASSKKGKRKKRR